MTNEKERMKIFRLSFPIFHVLLRSDLQSPQNLVAHKTKRVVV